MVEVTPPNNGQVDCNFFFYEIQLISVNYPSQDVKEDRISAVAKSFRELRKFTVTAVELIQVILSDVQNVEMCEALNSDTIGITPYRHWWQCL